ncbi:MAG: LysM peptidoglycan-binding domain-containing protein [Gammaproteobacteria bacterium]|nr:LysM peptidoglycan-binding domain-containing protein [Gammaproteobacteria bacterium]
MRHFIFIISLFLLAGCNQTSLATKHNDSPNVAQANTTIEQTEAAVCKGKNNNALHHDPLLVSQTNNCPFDKASEQVAIKQSRTNVWDDIRQGFALGDIINPRIEQHIKWYSSHPEHLKRTFERAKPFLAYIVEEAAKRQLPTEMVLLPVVESAFQTFAYSPGRAAGIWQIIPRTGKHLNLKQNWWYDGRRDVYASTQAALNLLQQLSKQYKGNWDHALAAYNGGSRRVSKEIRNNRKKGLSTDFWHLKLSRETRDYVPKLYALKHIIDRPADYGITLEPISNKVPFTVVDTGGQIDLAIAANLAELSIEELYQLNSGYNRWATAPNGPHRLLLPTKQAATFKAGLSDLPQKKRIKWLRHKIKEGETLSHIAVKYETTLAMLKRSNKLRKNQIRAGKYLLIPTATKHLSRYSLSSKQRTSRLQNTRRNGDKHIHIVQPGDSFWDIAQQFGVSVNKLARWNGMSPKDLLVTGKKLVVWTTTQQTPHIRSARNSGTPNQLQKIRYVVRDGDSLARIADKFRVAVKDLKNWNKVGKYIQPGQKLTLLVDIRRQSGEI